MQPPIPDYGAKVKMRGRGLHTQGQTELAVP